MKKFVIPAIILIVIVIITVGSLSMLKPPTTEKTANTNMQNSASSAEVPSDNIYLVKSDPAKGSYISDFQGQALYVSEKDTQGVSNCDAACAKAWPPYTSGAVAQSLFPKNITVITRSDGSKQFAWKGMPLYYFAQDSKPGEITGDNANGFHLAK